MVVFVDTQRLTVDDWPNYVPTNLNEDEDYDEFGGKVALDGDRAAVSLTRGVDYYSGSVFLLQKQTEHGHSRWTSQGIINAWDGDPFDRFGVDSIALCRDTLVVGAPYDDFYTNTGNPGAAYVFEFDNVNHVGTGTAIRSTTKLQPADVTSSSYYGFGSSLAIKNDIIIVGARQDNGSKEIPGSAYVFSKSKRPPTASATGAISSPWTQMAKLVASDGEKGNQFGNAVALTPDFVVIGACGSSEEDNGAVYVFNSHNNNWSEEVKLVPPTTASSLFGYSVAAAGNTIIVGAPGTNNKKGAIFVFTSAKDTHAIDGGRSWILQAELVPVDAVENDYFGISVDISVNTGDKNKNAVTTTIMAGAGVPYTSQTHRTFLYRFEQSLPHEPQWTLVERIAPPLDAVPYSDFGRNFAFSGDTLLVSNPGTINSQERHASSEGNLYVFERDGMPRPQTATTTTTDFNQRREQRNNELSPWMNLLISILILFIIQRVFLRNGVP
mmetsp:Transcript_20199/g.36658  ORF Transcript_20199/g.36658 Transcript_20199/m.36658 type:complete len:496 (+) Transcript_20199:60-1547(+)